MNKKKFILKIDNPCGQEWSSMTNINTGKFCTLCSRELVDFTQLTDNQVIEVIEHSSGKLCGRLTKDQLNRVIQFHQPKNNLRLYKLLAGLLFVGTSENLKATDIQQLQNVNISMVDKSSKEQLTKINTQPKIDSLKNYVQGLVIDAKTKSPLPFVSVYFKDTKISTMTSRDGKFKLLIPDNLLVKRIYLEISFLGYEKKQILINKTNLPSTLELIMEPSEQIFLGEIIVVKNKNWL